MKVVKYYCNICKKEKAMQNLSSINLSFEFIQPDKIFSDEVWFGLSPTRAYGWIVSDQSYKFAKRIIRARTLNPYS